ncbi:MAG: cellulase family glycosylhydrolase [Firmicutes bacterium]|nr:cellulase family glycosylhydrolase [Bacillota bacterium]
MNWGCRKLTIQLLGTILSLFLFTGCGAPAGTPEPAQPPATPPSAVNLPQIEVDPDGFKADGEPFRFIGANAVNLVFYDDWNLSVEEAIRTARENGLTVLRLYLDWGWGKPEDYDQILDIAAKQGVYVLLALTDCVPSSKSPYCDLASEQSMEAFKDRISQLLTRRNAVNNKRYVDDPTIMAWDIANEPELRRFSYTQTREWISEIAAHVKTVDPNHPVTIGLASDSSAYDQDGPSYSALDVPELDFYSFHYYVVPSSWDGEQPPAGFTSRIAFRARKLILLGKPVVMEEFGFSPSGKLNLGIRSDPERIGLYLKVYQDSMDAAFSAGASGVMFWSWGVAGARDVPMWWSPEDHSVEDTELASLLRNYRIPQQP